jgi:hypothetical protein
MKVNNRLMGKEQVELTLLFHSMEVVFSSKKGASEKLLFRVDSDTKFDIFSTG